VPSIRIVHRDDYLHGYNTDAPGLLHALADISIGSLKADNQVDLKGYTIVLLGAGGAARGAAFGLASAGIARMVVLNRHLERGTTPDARTPAILYLPIF